MMSSDGTRAYLVIDGAVSLTDDVRLDGSGTNEQSEGWRRKNVRPTGLDSINRKCHRKHFCRRPSSDRVNKRILDIDDGHIELVGTTSR